MLGVFAEFETNRHSHARAKPIDALSQTRLRLEPVSADVRTGLCSRAGIPTGKGLARPETGTVFLATPRRFRAAETAQCRISAAKAAESQRLFQRRRETGIAQECVVELAGLESANTRLSAAGGVGIARPFHIPRDQKPAMKLSTKDWRSGAKGASLTQRREGRWPSRFLPCRLYASAGLRWWRRKTPP
jgi:hypothetical protein